MDKQFWISIAKNEYKIPEGYSLENLTEILFGYLGSTDPELRDDIAYIVYANWLKREMYSSEMIKSHVDKLLSNLEQGIGEIGSDTVFMRTFSILLLAEIVHNDNKKPLLDKSQIHTILAKGLWYLDAEKDLRGYDPDKGWAHSLAHTADLLMVLAKNRNVDKIELRSILEAVAKKITQRNDHVYIHREDERLASAIVEIFKRNLLSDSDIEAWIESLLSPAGFVWRGRGEIFQESINRAFHNTRNLLRSVYLQVLYQKEIPEKDGLANLLLNSLRTLEE